MKSYPIQVRVSEGEKKAFQEAASIRGLSLSSWIRAVLRRASTQELENIGKTAAFLIENNSENG